MRNVWLENLDLSKKEQKVLEILSSVKFYINVTKIAEKADLPRATTLYTLRKLEKTKIVKKVTDGAGGKRFYWRKNITLLK